MEEVKSKSSPDLPYDAILIPGGGIINRSKLPLWTRKRLSRAVEIFQEGVFLVPLSAGTVHKPPPLDDDGYPVYESVLAAEYLLSNGIPPENILTEQSSYDTLGNAYFSRMIHAEPRRWKRLLIITSDFHLQRTKFAFRWIYNLTPLPEAFQLDFKGVPDDSLDPDVLADRALREKDSLTRIELLKPGITTLSAFHRWLFSEHSAYAVGKKPSRTSGSILNSY